jgi:hypothetical protein
LVPRSSEAENRSSRANRNPQAVVIDSKRDYEEQYSSAGVLCRFEELEELEELQADGCRSVASTLITGLPSIWSRSR